MPQATFDRDAHEHIEYHRDGSVRAHGRLKDGKPDGWEWYRLDGTRLRSGFFSAGQQVGDRTTYDRGGVAYKVTSMGPASPTDR